MSKTRIEALLALGGGGRPTVGRDRIALLERLLEEALPYIKYPRDATDAFVIAHDKMIERIRAALEG